jgi:AraC-like DNA-binding protein
MRQAPEPVVLRQVRHANAVAEVIDVRAPAEAAPPGGYSADYQVVLTYHGLFGYQVGRRISYHDANRTLFATRDQSFVDSHPVNGLGHSALVVAPGPELREELFGSVSPGRHPVFLAAAAPASARLRLMTHLLRTLRSEAADTLRADEAIVAALSEALSIALRPGGGPSRIVDRAKELLHARASEPLSLQQFAREVGCSPAYLTREFTRVEGLPLYRYQLSLRLNEALLRLPGCDGITALALDLGFSSHAHFTAAFSAAFAMSPSQYRTQARAGAAAITPARRRAA